MKFSSCILQFLLSDPVDYAVGILLQDPVNLLPWTFILLLRSCRTWILEVCSVVGSWDLGYYAYRILNVCFIAGYWRSCILMFWFWSGILRDPGSLNFAMLGDPGDIGSWLRNFAMGSCRSWILTFYFAFGSCGSWILIFGCGICLNCQHYVEVHCDFCIVNETVINKLATLFIMSATIDVARIFRDGCIRPMGPHCTGVPRTLYGAP